MSAEQVSYYGQRDFSPLKPGENRVYDGLRTESTQLNLEVLTEFMRRSRLRAFINIEEITSEKLVRETCSRMQAVGSDLMPQAPQIIMETAQLSVDRLPGVITPLGYTASYEIYLKIQRDHMDNETLLRTSNQLATRALGRILREEKLRFMPRHHVSVPFPGLRSQFLLWPSVDIPAYSRGRIFLAHHGDEFIIPRQEEPEEDIADTWEAYRASLKNRRGKPKKSP